MTRAVGYVRVSSERQVDSLSLPAQRRALAAYCERHGYELVDVYADEGISAHTDRIEKRPAFARLLADAERGAFDLVLVHTLDRWARRSSVQAATLERLGRAGVGFASCTESVDYTTPGGKLMLTMMGGVSEFFSDQLATHVSKSQQERARLGLPVGPIPFGYQASDDPRTAPPPDRAAAEAVRQVFARRAAGASYDEIAAWLNGAGFRSRPQRKAAPDGRPFSSFAVRDLLRCRFYVGVVTYRGTEYPGLHEALVDEALFARVQDRRLDRRHARRSHGPTGALTGRVRCAACGHPLYADRTAAGTPRYREKHGRLLSDGRPCATHGRSVLSAEVDGQMGAVFGAMQLRPELIEAAVQAAARTHEGPSIDSLRDQRRRAGRAYEQGAYGEGAAADREYEERIAAIDARIRAARPAEAIQIEEAREMIEALPRVWAEASADVRRTLVAPLVQQVYVDVDARRIAGFEPVAGLRALLERALRSVAIGAVRLIPPGGWGDVEMGGLEPPLYPSLDRVSAWRVEWVA